MAYANADGRRPAYIGSGATVVATWFHSEGDDAAQRFVPRANARICGRVLIRATNPGPWMVAHLRAIRPQLSSSSFAAPVPPTINVYKTRLSVHAAAGNPKT